MNDLKVGDSGFVAEAHGKETWVTCPECLGKCYLRVILGDGSEVTIDCVCCERGYEGSPGRIASTEFTAWVQAVTIRGMSIEAGQPTRYTYDIGYSTEDLFGTREEAEQRAVELALEHERDEAKRLRNKEKQTKSWAWNVAYHRRAIREAEKQIKYHTAKLSVAKVEAKSDAEARVIAGYGPPKDFKTRRTLRIKTGGKRRNRT